MENKELIYKMAFSFLKKRVGQDFIRYTMEKGVDPEGFFSLSTKDLVLKLGIKQEHEFDKMIREEAVMLAQKEFSQIQSHNITPLFVLDDNYPESLKETPDPPVILYKLGDADLDAEHMVAIVGTRKPTSYGIESCNKIVEDIAGYFPDCIIVSGLAYGIDATAHQKALETGLTTVAVVAHGLNMIYPAANRNIAKEIIYKGGAIISEYPFGTKPFRANFLARNRIVAGISQATIVVESNIKGGAMSTANYAFMFNRDVMAFPGRSTDDLSSGCNLLIRKNKAHLIECAADLIDITGWQPLDIPIDPRQRNLFPELDGDSRRIYEILQFKSEPLQLDQLINITGLSASKLLSLLSELEFDGIIVRHPGNRYSLS